MIELCSKCGRDITNEGIIYIEDKPYCVDCKQQKERDEEQLKKAIEEELYEDRENNQHKEIPENESGTIEGRV